MSPYLHLRKAAHHFEQSRLAPLLFVIILIVIVALVHKLLLQHLKGVDQLITGLCANKVVFSNWLCPVTCIPLFLTTEPLVLNRGELIDCF